MVDMETKRKAFFKVMNGLDYEESVVIGSYVDELMKQAERANKNAQDLDDIDKQLHSTQQQNERYLGVFKQLYNFDGDVQEHSKLADMLISEILEGEN